MPEICFFITIGVVLLAVVVPVFVIGIVMAMQPGSKSGPLDHRVAPCVSCNREIPVDAKKCPHCGAIN